MIRDNQTVATARAFAAAGTTPAVVPQVPAWAAPSGPVANDAEAAFCAGAALTTLDALVRNQPAWAGAWRQRLALKGAASAIKLAGRTEDEAALRDGLLLSRSGEGSTTSGSLSLGPAGSILAAWRNLAARPLALDTETLRKTVEQFGLRWDDTFVAIPEQVEMLLRADAEQVAPFAAAAMAAKVYAARPDAEMLCWWLADWILAQKLRWPRPVPLLMAQAFTPVFFRAEGSRGARSSGRKIRPGDEHFERAVCLALARGATEACRMGAEMSRRAERLMAVAPKLRAKGAPAAIRLLLDDDAVSGALVTKNLSRFASRRLFDRLCSLGAVRELSGRSTFRIYGL